ncbi:MAG TPA: DUF695 domain-containing protein [Candidatus Acidoferrum sp.]|nr:DUF695 domain-containing protein [Candidatus Acidoferrum sp.]
MAKVIAVAFAVGLLIGATLLIAFRRNRGTPANAGTFAVFQGRLDGRPVFATIDTSLRNFPDKSKFPYFLSIETKLESPTPDGLTRVNEADELNAWEDELETRLKSVGEVVFVGRVTWNGRRELLYYTDGDRRFEQALTVLSGSTSMRSFRFSSERDDRWSKANYWLTLHN